MDVPGAPVSTDVPEEAGCRVGWLVPHLNGEGGTTGYEFLGCEGAGRRCFVPLAVPTAATAVVSESGRVVYSQCVQV